MTPLQVTRYVAWLIIFTLGCSLAGVYTAKYFQRTPLPDRPVLGAPFQLTDQNGRVFSSAQLEGRPYTLFFGFTYCPDICPTTLMEVTELMKKLGAESDKFRPVFITVDPERDTAPALRDYMSSFDSRIIALTGSTQAIDRVVRSYKAYAAKSMNADGSYTMDHTANIYIFDRQGQLAGTLDRHENQEVWLAKIRRVISE